MNKPTIAGNVIRLKELKKRIPLSTSTIYERINPKSPRYDESFPKPIKLGGSAVGWLESGVDAWLEKQVLISESLI